MAWADGQTIRTLRKVSARRSDSEIWGDIIPAALTELTRAGARGPITAAARPGPAGSYAVIEFEGRP